MIKNITRLPSPLAWSLPAKTTHDGLPLGNGLFGALLWGESHALRMTINRQDYWDHRGGIVFGEEATYGNIRRWLEQGDEETLRTVFEGNREATGSNPSRPTRLPMGRVDIVFDESNELVAGELDIASGRAVLAMQGMAATQVEALVPRGRPMLAVVVRGAGAARCRMASCPADGPEVRAYWHQYGIPEPVIDDYEDEGGWLQELPADDALYVGWRRLKQLDGSIEFLVTAAYGGSPEMARLQARGQLDWAERQGFEILAGGEADWWRGYWRQAARVTVPDTTIQELYDLGMYKLPGISWPGTPAATLQGPWVEEYRMPPWSSDYHFNINVQECYWPAYAGNQLQALGPLWQLIREWMPKLKENARNFLGLDDGLMLNHAVDDRCTCMGGFWTGSIDHGATAWVAQMMWLTYRYTLDRDFLVRTAYPFMHGVMLVYEAMLEEQDDGTLALPVSVSPEYEGSAMWAWGRDASFQLAIIHFLIGALVQADRILERTDEVTARWQSIADRLPRVSAQGEGDQREIILWQGQPLAHSHRHHSHLAGLYPFDVLDPWGDPEDRALVEQSMRTWTRMGQGEWSGWCMPWAAILWMRMHEGDRAVDLLHQFERYFVRPGRASTHDAVLPGLTVYDGRPDVMQIEATMAASAAVLEMLAHTARGVLYILPAVPRDWQELAFERLRVEGAMLVSAEMLHGELAWARIHATCHTKLTVCLPGPEGSAVSIVSDKGWRDEGIAGRLYRHNLVGGETLYLTANQTEERYDE